MKLIKMDGGLPKKSFAAVPGSTLEPWFGESPSWRQSQTSQGENLKNFMTVACFPSPSPLLSQKETRKKNLQ